MLIKLRIYRKHDIDLLALLANSSFNFVDAVKNSLRIYVRGTGKKISLPVDYTYNRVIDYFSVQVNIPLSETTDADIISFVQRIPKGSRNCLIKSLLRNCLEAPFFEGAYAELVYKKKEKGKTVDVDKMVYDVIHTSVGPTNDKPVILDAAADELRRG